MTALLLGLSLSGPIYKPPTKFDVLDQLYFVGVRMIRKSGFKPGEQIRATFTFSNGAKRNIVAKTTVGIIQEVYIQRPALGVETHGIALKIGANSYLVK